MSFQIALLQFCPMRKNLDENIRLIRSMLSGLKSDLIVLPELSNSGYLYESSSILEQFSEPSDVSGPFLSAIQILAGESDGIIVTGYSELAGNGLYNSAAAVSKDGLLSNYRKTHLYATEKNLFQPGESGFKVFQWKNVQIGLMVCFDWIFPESARSLALQGAQIIAHPANLVLPYCQDAMVTRSIENRVFSITANRIGQESLQEKMLNFTGKSQITHSSGKVLYRAPQDKATLHVMSIDPEEANQKMISNNNHLLRDRRPELYKT